jgi:hypothetical protein
MPQHPIISAELAARITAAAAVRADFHREVDDYLDRDGERPDYSSWAFLLERALQQVLDGIGDPDLSGIAQPGGGFISGPMIMPRRAE